MVGTFTFLLIVLYMSLLFLPNNKANLWSHEIIQVFFKKSQIHSKEFRLHTQLDNHINITTQHLLQLGNERNLKRLSISNCLIRITIQNSPCENLTQNSHYEMYQKRSFDSLNCNGCLAEMILLHMKTDKNGFQLHGTGGH